jgi:hypothetical protein
MLDNGLRTQITGFKMIALFDLDYKEDEANAASVLVDDFFDKNLRRLYR